MFDDTHQAERDGEAEGGEQQHAAEADPVKEVPDHANQEHAGLDAAER